MNRFIHDSSPNSENLNPQRRLYADGWDYNVSDPFKLIDLFVGSRSDPLYEKLESAWFQDGGKVFGLRLCELIAAQCPGLYVPAWMPVSSFSFRSGYVKTPIFPEEPDPIDKWLAYNFQPPCIIRSSDYGEDWQDGRAGVSDSLVSSSRMLKSKVRKQLEANTHLVIQELVFGIGCVFDIVYSPLLKRNVVRIAAGKKSVSGSGDSWTSATWDNEATMGLWDIKKRDWIIPFPEQHWLHRSIKTIIEELVNAIFSLQIDFGLQLELIVHPEMQYQWCLVQLRPSPNLVRGPREVQKTSGKIINTTIRVNKAGSATGEILLAGNDRRFGELSRKISDHSSSAGRIDEEFLDRAEWLKELQQSCNDKIVLWYHQCALDKYSSVYQVRGVARMGAAAQLARHSLFINSAHGTSLPFSQESKVCWEEARNQSILMGDIDRDVYREWIKRIRKGENIRLNLVSDGIVGQIYEK